MFKTILSSLFFVLCVSFSFSQDKDLLISSLLPIELQQNINAAIRYNDINIEVLSYNKVILKRKRIVTVYNEYGNNKIDAYVSYDENIIIKKLQAKIYNAFGKEIKKVKKGDFQDESAVSGGTLYSDSRVKYLSYTPVNYPYTVVFETEIEYRSTAFMTRWLPLEGFYVSTQNSSYKIINNSDVEVKIKISNFEGYNIEKLSEYSYVAKNIKAIKPELYSPQFNTYAPNLKAALVEFNMEGVKGINNNWKDFGKWMNDNLLEGTVELPENILEEVRALTKDVDDKMERAKIVYNYMQEKTRYISVQVGIGGWKPSLANDVDRLGYSDCKGLSNYTRALLNDVGVEAHYAVIYGGRGIKSIDADFSATEGNHVILCIPDEDENVWLECTSQTNPFGYIANFTDDRDALLITPEGGKIAHTTVYNTEESLQLTKANIQLDNQGNINADVTIKTTGYQYALHEGVQNKTQKEQQLSIKEYWDNINNLTIEKIKYDNNKDDVVFTEDFKISALNYATKSGNRLLFQPNAFNKVTHIPTRYKNRTLDFQIERGFTDKDEFIIELPSDLSIEAMSEGVSITTQFGSYEYSITVNEDNNLVYKRTYILNKGYYPKEDYAAFRDFRKQIVKHDKTKIVLINKT